MRPSISSTFRSDFNRLLCRLEQTVPFPVDPKEFYYSLFSEVFRPVFELKQELGAAAIDMTVQHRNTLTVLRQGMLAPIYLGVSTLGDDMYMRMLFAQRMPLPIESNETGDPHAAIGVLVTPRTHPHWQKIADWHERATALEEKLSAFRDVFERIEDDYEAMECWKELLSALGRRLRKKSPPSTALIRLDRRVSSLAREEFNELLAKAVLLPDIRPPHVWVGLNATATGER